MLLFYYLYLMHCLKLLRVLLHRFMDSLDILCRTREALKNLRNVVLGSNRIY